TTAVTGDGIADLVDLIDRHQAYLLTSGGWLQREKERARHEIEQLLVDQFISRLETAVPAPAREQLVTAVAEREMDPYTAVDTLMFESNSI
ncbi:MAG: methylmalonyl Co-A mutase-associated GTPase MeaB, partial [Chloroflexi bacterium]|nr:methylmalonyl Co-A mutase-associated GTPase MeaB [Chloroflexota bacterium]